VDGHASRVRFGPFERQWFAADMTLYERQRHEKAKTLAGDFRNRLYASAHSRFSYYSEVSVLSESADGSALNLKSFQASGQMLCEPIGF
jgi:hypothetical protein